ncbi:MAG: YciI family protein [Myxococcota bacterium]
MQYMCLIYADPTIAKSMTPAEMGAYMGGYRDFTESIKTSGAMIAGDALQGVETATSVRVRDGKTVVTDGPFAVTKEHLGGYYLIEAPDLDAATAIAARIPSAKHGTIEVRPVMVWDK